MECLYDIGTFSVEIGNKTSGVSKTGYMFVDLCHILPVFRARLLKCCINISHQFMAFKWK